MTPTSTSAGHMATPPNHHAHHPGFAGLSGLVAALVFTIGRNEAADLAIGLTGAGPNDDVVDIGCGPGVAVRRAARQGAASVVGVDPAAVMLRVARPLTWVRPHGRQVRYLEGAAEALPLPDDSATVAWSLSTVHHWRDVDAGLAEVRRVLHSSGRFLAVERRAEPGATGHASHGWTDDQAELFAARCHAAGFPAVEVGGHDLRRRRVISVLATAAEAGPVTSV